MGRPSDPSQNRGSPCVIGSIVKCQGTVPPGKECPRDGPEVLGRYWLQARLRLQPSPLGRERCHLLHAAESHLMWGRWMINDEREEGE